MLSLRESIAAAEVAREKLTSQQSAGSHTGVVAAILKAAEHGGPLAGAGVIGRLGDLATISPEYDIAVRCVVYASKNVLFISC